MANSSQETNTRSRVRRRSGLFYCHSCQEEVEPCMPEYTCSLCGGGFIEPLAQDEETPESENMEVTEATDRPMRRGMRRTRIAIHQFHPGALGQNNLQTFMQQFMTGLTGGNINEDQNRQLNIQIAPFIINSGDFVFSRNGLDNIITMLMNQLDNAGPPPAAKESIDTLPVIGVQQDVVDRNVQCHICMEDFQLEEQVRRLPCQHIYHNDCILPWLELHGTCPICRKPIDPPVSSSITNNPAVNPISPAGSTPTPTVTNGNNTISHNPTSYEDLNLD